MDEREELDVFGMADAGCLKRDDRWRDDARRGWCEDDE